MKGTATLGTVTEKYATLEIPPPGAGFVTVIEAVVAEAVSEAEMLAVTCDSLTSLVGRGLPFQFTTEPETKPVAINRERESPDRLVPWPTVPTAH